MSVQSACSYASLFARGLRGEHEAAPDAQPGGGAAKPGGAP